MMPRSTQEIRFDEIITSTTPMHIAAAILVLAETIAKVGNQTHDHNVEVTTGAGVSLDVIVKPPSGETFHVQMEEL